MADSIGGAQDDHISATAQCRVEGTFRLPPSPEASNRTQYTFRLTKVSKDSLLQGTQFHRFSSPPPVQVSLHCPVSCVGPTGKAHVSTQPNVQKKCRDSMQTGYPWCTTPDAGSTVAHWMTLFSVLKPRYFQLTSFSLFPRPTHSAQAQQCWALVARAAARTQYYWLGYDVLMQLSSHPLFTWRFQTAHAPYVGTHAQAYPASRSGAHTQQVEAQKLAIELPAPMIRAAHRP